MLKVKQLLFAGFSSAINGVRGQFFSVLTLILRSCSGFIPFVLNKRFLCPAGTASLQYQNQHTHFPAPYYRSGYRTAFMHIMTAMILLSILKLFVNHFFGGDFKNEIPAILGDRRNYYA
jgi:hypothetical protein